MSDSYTRIFHELMEPLLRLDLSGTQFRILLWVARNSYGRGGAFFAPYSWRKIAKDIKASRPSVMRQGMKLLQAEILRLGGDGEIGINKDRIRSLDLCPQAHVPTGTDAYRHMNPVPTGTPHPYKKERRKCDSTADSTNSSTNVRFEQVWVIYPKKRAKGNAKKAWNKLKMTDDLFKQIISAIETQKQTEDWLKENGKYVPHLATWLNGQRWEDEIPTSAIAARDGANSQLERMLKATQERLNGKD